MFIYQQGGMVFPGQALDLSAAELDRIPIEAGRPKSGPLRHLGAIVNYPKRSRIGHGPRLRWVGRTGVVGTI
jgi:hypothetical protein